LVEIGGDMITFGELKQGETVGVDLGSHYEVWRVKNIKGFKNGIWGADDSVENHVWIEFTNGQIEIFEKKDSIAGSMMKKFIADKKEFENKLTFHINKLYKLIDEMLDEEDTVF
jgi:hypothetical protein